MLNQDSLNLSEIIDHLITVPVFSGSSLASRPVVLDLYEAARGKFGRPLCFDATEKILLSSEKEAVKTVIITTGFIVPPWLEAETDGPVGAVTLARSLNLAFDAVPVLVTEKHAVQKTKSLLEATGFRVGDIENAKKPLGKRTGLVVGFTTDVGQAVRESEDLISKTSPFSIISIEKASPNRVGVFHSGVGVDVSKLSAKVDKLVEHAKNTGILTVGIGDAGNEIGMGCIEKTVREILPTGSDCGCPCHQGVASAVATDGLMVTGTSNWGASAIEALLAFHYKVPELLHDGATEVNLIRRSAELGFIDPASGFADPGVDAIPAKMHGALIELLNFITNSRMKDSYYIKKYREYTRDKKKLAEEIEKAGESQAI